MQYHILLASLVLGLVVSTTFSQQPVPIQAVQAEVLPEAVALLPVNPVVSATSYVVLDVQTGAVLLSKNSTVALPIASIAKLFTAAAAIASDELEEPVQVTAADVATLGRAGKLRAGEVYTVRELLFPLLLESSNDAAAVLERELPALEFPGVNLADASGLSARNTASAENLALAVRSLFLEQPYIFDITKLPQYIGTETGWVNNSPVRDLPGYAGGKHGYTEAANRTVVAFFTEPSLGEKVLAYVVLGSDDVRADTLTLRAAIADSVQAK